MSVSGKFQTAIFWVTTKQIILFAKHVCPEYRGISDYPSAHVDMWQNVIHKRNQRQNKKYDDFPRGRMMYDNNSEIYRIYVATCLIKDNKLIDIILKKLSMTLNDRVVVVENAYY